MVAVPRLPGMGAEGERRHPTTAAQLIQGVDVRPQVVPGEVEEIK